MQPVSRLASILLAGLLLVLPWDALAHGVEDLHGPSVGDHPSAAATPATATGTITELTVEDRAAALTYRALGLAAAGHPSLTLRGDGLADLHTGMQVEVTGQKEGHVMFVDRWRLAAPGSVGEAANAKLEATASGTLRMMHADYFEEGRSEYLFEVAANDGQATDDRPVRVAFGVIPDTLQPGMDVDVRGPLNAKGEIEASHVTIRALPHAKAEPVAAKSTTVNSVLVVLVRFTDSVANPFTQAQVQTVMGGGAGSGSVAEYYKEASYGQQQMSVTVTPWLSSSSAAPSDCNFTTIGSLADSAAAANGYTASNYNFVVYVFPSLSSCGWAGLGYVGAPRKAWINGYNRTQVYAHEMGHNFGLLHAASLSCTGTPIASSGCSSAEYGDPFDTMGNQRAMHFNAAQKNILGWFAPSAVKTHTTGTATYVLTPISLAGGSLYAVNVPAASNRKYWIEYRQPIGFDSPISAYPNLGALVHIAYPFQTICSNCADDTELLDMTPATGSLNDAVLPVNNTFTDSSNGFTLSVLSATSTALTVSVTMPGAIANSTTTLNASPNPANVGATVSLTATITGSAPTGTVVFRDNGTAIAGCSSVTLAGSGNTRTATCTTSFSSSGSHALTAAYAGDAGNSASSGAATETVNATTSTNFALATNGGMVSVSSTFGAGYPASALNNNERAGAGWTSGGVWADATYNAYPDWVQVNFPGSRTIDHVVVYSLQDDPYHPVEPSSTQTFGLYGVSDFVVQGWNGSAWVTLGQVAGNRLVKRTVTFSPYTTDRIRITVSNALNGYSRITEIEAWGTGAVNQTNVAAATSGATASASSTFGAGYPASALINGERAGAGWTAGGAWADATYNSYPDWAQINFSGSKTIDHVVLYSLQDDPDHPVEPSDTQTFSLYGVTDFVVQGWNGSGWVTLAQVSGNRLVKRSVSFAAYTTDRIRVTVNGALNGYARVTEIEAWGTSAITQTNVAAGTAGATVTASSTFGAGYPAAALINGERAGAGWTSGGVWADATYNAYPDWVQINFAGSKTIDHIVLYSLQDDPYHPVEPSDSQAFSLYGVTDFVVQGWTGSAWVTLAQVTGNGLVKRTVSFSAYTTDRIRVTVNNALNGYARITEIEAWGN
jgi:hypothetical protein